jgi:2-polyprenyl-6-methoxyphenol hydroxylase-like FAD-dependent oxidoreductase
VRSVRRDGQGLFSVHLDDGRFESGFRLVVGADGAWSKVRDLVSCDCTSLGVWSTANNSKVTSAKPQFSGLYYFSTNIGPDSPMHSSAKALAGEGNYMAFGDERMLGTMMLGDGSYYTFVGMHLPEHWRNANAALAADPVAMREWLLRDQLVKFGKVHTDLIEHSSAPFFVWPLYGMPIESLSWETVPGIALVGDAAHLT